VSHDDAPTFVKTNPSLRHTADLIWCGCAVKKRRCHREIATKCGDHGRTSIDVRYSVAIGRKADIEVKVIYFRL